MGSAFLNHGDTETRRHKGFTEALGVTLCLRVSVVLESYNLEYNPVLSFENGVTSAARD